MGEETEPKTPKTTSSEWKHAKWVSIVGKWAWIVALINGVLAVILSIYWIASAAIYWQTVIRPYYEALLLPVPPLRIGTEIWYLIGAIITVVVSIIIIRPKFSNRCADKDWDALYGWVLNLGKLRFPWMLFWGFFIEIFGFWGWAGLMILIPAFVLLFAGPETYEWTK